MAQKKEQLMRIYDSVRNFIGENAVFKCGDVLYVSTKNNDVYDMVVVADGKSKFLELYRLKQEESYPSVSYPSELAGMAGQDIRIASDDVVNAITADMPYFKNVIIGGAEVSQSIIVKAEERITLDDIVISGGKGSSNGKMTYAANELVLKNITAKDGSTLYNAFEGYQKTDDPKYKGLQRLVAENLDINCPSITHNIINVYTPANGAEIFVRNSKFNLTVDNSNVLRLANYMNAENVTVIFENCDWTYENGITKNDWKWAGLAIYQPSSSDVALNGDMSKLKTWKFIIKNCRYNGEKVTANNFGQHNQVVYLYDINRSGAVSDPANVQGLEIIFG